tara:strand:+ start:1880 stop:2746 length:867 start_codon:yes stop_codon:yes gene_type:complete
MYIDNFQEYISVEKRFSKNTVISYLQDLNQFFKFLSSEYNVSNNTEINFHLVRHWITRLLENGLEASSVNRKISTLKTYFRFLEREGYVKENPMFKIISPKAKKRLPIFLEEEKINNLLDDIKFESGFKGQRDKLIIELFYLTGMRLSELINIKIKDLNFNNFEVKVIGKRKKERIIPLSDKIIKSIKMIIDNKNSEDYLFTNTKGDKLYNKMIYRVVNKYIGKVSSMKKKSPHILRHTFATHMLNNGADINAIKELLGHSNLSATQVYTHNTIEKLKKIYHQSHPRA